MRFNHGWWMIDDPDPDDTDNYFWCIDTFGAPNSADGRWFFESSSCIFYFKKERDAMWFELRWAEKYGRKHTDTIGH